MAQHGESLILGQVVRSIRSTEAALWVVAVDRKRHCRKLDGRKELVACEGVKAKRVSLPKGDEEFHPARAELQRNSTLLIQPI